MLSLLQFADVNDGQKLEFIPPYLAAITAEIWEHRFTVATFLVGAFVISGTLSAVSAMFRRLQTKNVNIVRRILDDLVVQHFETRQPEFIYRATLFRQYSFWPFGAWLGIAQRSGDVYASRRTVFSVNPQNNENCTGIAGECWWRAQAQLPSRIYMTLPPHSADDQANLEYLDAGFIDTNEFKCITKPAVYFHTMEIRVNGKVWGVLIVDSTDTSVQVKQESKNNRHISAMDRAVTAITWVLE